MLLEMDPDLDPSLPKTPLARLGTIIHQVVRDASRKGQSRIAPLVMARLADRTDSIASYAGPSGRLPLSQAIRRSVLLKRIGHAQKQYSEKFVGDSYRGSRGSSSPPRGPREAVDPLPSAGSLSLIEETLESSRLQLRGQVDRLDRDDSGNVEISDFKTGRLHDSEGSLHADHRLQLLGYGLLAREVGVVGLISLRLVGSDGEERFPFDAEAEEEVRDLLGTLIASIPRDESLPAEQLARVGPACRFCAFRPSCSRYVREAPALWASDEPPAWLPCDSWGRIERIESADPALCHLYILDEAGRLTSVRNVPSGLLPAGLQAGDRAVCFSLNPVPKLSRTRPDNFELIDPVHLAESAHGAKVFFEQTGVVGSDAAQ